MAPLILLGIVIFVIWLCSKDSYSQSSNNYKTRYTTQTSQSSTTNYATSSYELSKLREEFNEIKKTESFKKWKKAQYDCQYGKCAWCKNQLDLHSPNTQTDHIKPLCKGGTNSYDNFVLACKSCNYYCKKGNYVWRDHNGTVHNGWNKPNWIRENPFEKVVTYPSRTDNHYVDKLDLTELPF